MHVPRTEHRALAVTELVEHEQRVIARAPEVSVVRRSLLLSVYRTLRTVHVQDHPPVRRAGHSSVHPLSVHSAQPFHVAVLRKHRGLEPAHGARARRRSVYASVSNDYTHRRIVGQPFRVVGILVARQTTVHRLPEKARLRRLEPIIRAEAGDPTTFRRWYCLPYTQAHLRRLEPSSTGSKPTAHEYRNSPLRLPHAGSLSEGARRGRAKPHTPPPHTARLKTFAAFSTSTFRRSSSGQSPIARSM